MTFFWIIGLLFLLGALYNVVTGNFADALAGVVVSAFFFTLYAARYRKWQRDAAKLAAQDPRFMRCCKCGSSSDVAQRAYLLTYSVIVYSSKSAGAFNPICKRCSIISGLHYSLVSLLVGWWGIPFGPIFTVQAVYRNFRGGVIVPNEELGSAKPVAAQRPVKMLIR